MTTKQRKTDRIMFRLTHDQRERVQLAAKQVGKDEGAFVRDLVLLELARIAPALERQGTAA